MKDLKPKFMLTRVYNDGSQDEPEIAPLSKVIAEAKMNRRGFFGTGLTAAAAIVLLDGCKLDKVKLEYPNTDVSNEPYEGCEGIHAHDSNVTALTISPDGKRLFSGSHDGTVKIWSLPDGAFIQTLNDESAVYSLAVSPDGKWLFSGSYLTVKIWSLPKGKLVETLFQDFDYEHPILAVSPDGNRLFFSGSSSDNNVYTDKNGMLHSVISNDKNIYIYNLQNLQDGKSIGMEKIFTGHSNDIHSLVVSPDGKQLFSMSKDNINKDNIINKDIIKIWNLPKGRLRKTLTMKSESKWWSGSIRNLLAVSPDGKCLFTSDDDGFITLIKLPNGSVTRKIKAGDDIRELTVSPDGKWLVSASEDSNSWYCQLWSLPDFVLKKRKQIPGRGILTFNADSQWLVLGIGADIQLMKLPDLTVEKCLMDLACVEDTVKGVTYSVTDEWGRTVTYTLPCGSPIPAGAKCICNCVPGEQCSCHSNCSCHSHCTCNKVCTCNSQCTCQSNRYCECHYVGSCSCNKVCTCNKVCICLGT